MKEFPIYLRDRPLNLSIDIVNLKFKDFLSIKNSTVLKDYVTNIHAKSFASLNGKIGIISSIGHGEKRSAERLIAPIAIRTDGTDTKRSAASAGTNHIEICTVGNVVSAASVGQKEVNRLGIVSEVGELSDVVLESINEKIGIMGGRYMTLGEHDDKSLDMMDDKTLHTLDLFEVLILHELNYESADESVVIACDCTETSQVYVSMEPSVMGLQDDAATIYMVQYRKLIEADGFTMDDMDNMTLEDIDYIIL